MSDFSKEIVKELGLAGIYGLSLKELFYNLNILEKDQQFQEFFYKNMKKLKLGIIFTGTSKESIQNLTFDHLMNNSHYRFTVSDTQREWAVMGSFYKSICFSDATFLIFSLIAKSKSFGISQVELAKAASMDAKTVFHHLKILGIAKVIVKYPIIYNGSKTHLCIHLDYADQNSGYQKHVQLRTTNIVTQDDFCYVDSGINHAELVKVKISTLLENSKNQLLATDDLFDVIEEESGESFNRRLFNRILQKMQNSGFLEIVYIPLEEEKTLRAVKLLRPFRLYKSKEYTGFEKNSESSLKYALKRSNDMLLDQASVTQGRFLSDLSIEWQIFRLIYLSGSQGVTSNMIFKSLRMEGVKMMDKIMERLLKGDVSKGLSITKVFENMGREKRYRYFACKKAVDHFRDDPENSEYDLDDNNSGKKRSLKKSAIHLSSLQRRNNLLELLEIHKVLECGYALIDVYESLMEERGTQTAYRIDRKTLERTAKSLQDDKLLSMHVIRVPQMAGSVLSKTILLHKSLTMKDPIVLALIDSIQSKAFQINAYEKRIIENVDIERLKPRKKKSRYIENPVKESPVIQEAPVYRGNHDPNLIEFPFPAQEMDEEAENQNSTSWIACLLKHGYVQNVLPRARILHAWLFQKLSNGAAKEPVEFENDGWFSLAMLMNDLEISMYMKLVGLTTEPQVLQDFLNEGRSASFTTGNLPQQVRDVIFSKGYMRYRREIRNVLNELEKYKVITPGDNQIQGDNLWTKYRLNTDVAIPASDGTFGTYKIQNLETLGTFWVKVNYIENKIKMSKRTRKLQAKRSKADEMESHEVVEDKEKLEAVTKGLSVSEIMKLEKQEKAPRSSFRSRLSMKKEPAKKSENVLTMKAISQNDHIKPRQRVQWTSDMLLRLMVYYTILSHDSRPKNILIWKSITAKFPKYGENRCKKQIESAKKDSFLSSQLQWLKVKWEKTINENFNGGQINFDLDQLSDLLVSKIDVESWSRKGYVHEMSLEPESNQNKSNLDERDVEKWISDKQTTKSKLSYLLKFPFTCHLYNPKEVDDYSNENMSESDLRKEVAKATIKSILLTSESNYDPFVASVMLEAIEPKILDVAFSELNSSFILSKVKGGKDRQGPGRGYQLSDRFLTSLSAGFSVGFMSNAKSFFKNLLSSSPITYSISIGRGEMACILNELPQKTIKLQPLVSLVEDESLETQEYSFPISICYNVKSTDCGKRSEAMVSDAQSKSVKKRRTVTAETESPHRLTKSQDLMLSIIKKGGLFGATKCELKKSLNSDARSLESDLKVLELSHISRVGFSVIRYVVKALSDNWKIKKETACYPPELWYDISGEVVPIFLETAIENCVSVIHNFPGIYFSKILSMLPISTVELVKLLEILEDRGIISKRILHQPTIPMLQGNSNCDEISSYRLTSDCHIVDSDSNLVITPAYPEPENAHSTETKPEHAQGLKPEPGQPKPEPGQPKPEPGQPKPEHLEKSIAKIR